ncbi:Fas apoptotic inhibitory molecule 1 [Orchesella cincta]|uniref:Fas apoptotic inhibitory molecule 1 n=1 Tax=Orchesella cincta TaxID=48709 RepID=A0A1D2NAD3_ORCCI|nr:Fas apoptotic inhibitory molecule 1 [Orchesella cincta]
MTESAESPQRVSSDRVAVWEVPLNSGLYMVEFEHGTTTGKRVVRVNGKDVLRRDWMFKLVGAEEFKIDKSVGRIKIDPVGIFAYRYCLEVDGKSFRQFIERQSKILKSWTTKTVDGTDLRVVLEKDTLDIYVNGEKVETQSDFVDGGTATHFEAANYPATLHALCTGIKKQPIIYSLTFNGEQIAEASE